MSEMNTYTISATWGKSCNYVPASVYPFVWDGSLSVSGGEVTYLDKLHYRYCQWTQAHEVREHLYDSLWACSREPFLRWRSTVEPGGPLTLEGIRFHVEGDENTVITIALNPITISFKLGELLDRSHLRYHVGPHYAGVPVDVFLGEDARPRMLPKQYLENMDREGRCGQMIMPKDFTGGRLGYHHSAHGCILTSGETACARFPLHNISAKPHGDCSIRIQATADLGYTEPFTTDCITFKICFNGEERSKSYYFTNRLFLPKMEDIYLAIPWEGLYDGENEVTVTYEAGNYPLLIHRIYVGEDMPSMAYRIPQLPPLKKDRYFHVGSETDLLTPENGDVDWWLDTLHNEELGDYVMFRERCANADENTLIRWCNKAKKYGFLSATSGATEESLAVYHRLLGDRFFGEHGHEISNLAYGWGDADPIEERIGRTLPECKAKYLERMSAFSIIGQVLPMQYLDYEAGADILMSEVPGSHATLVLNAARGASKVYNKPVWGIHAANHVTAAPLEWSHVRRLFILTAQAWLRGASIVYDEEVMYRYNHDTIYAYSEELPTAYRSVYQNLYHYAGAVRLGKELIPTAFLQGNFDMLIGGAQARPFTERSHFWGEFGPETEGWTFDTPEAGWKLAESYLPGVWLYPVLQDRSKLRLFFAGSPKGQSDLIPITADVDKLSAYEVLVLPGWNTMTEELYRNLVEYVRRGGHLVLCAAQCTTHITRDFLVDKNDFSIIHDGDLSELCGVRVGHVEGVINQFVFDDDTVFTDPGVPGIQTELCGGTALATDQDGHPVLVENAIGAGRVWTLTVGEYWGHDALDRVRTAICDRLYTEHRPNVYLTGNTDDVDSHVYAEDGQTRVVLLNTDWTSAGNCKRITLHTEELQVPVSVREGYMKHILLKDDVAVGFDMPSAIVEDLIRLKNTVRFTVQGSGSVTLSLYAAQTVASITVDGEAAQLTGHALSVFCGDVWSEHVVEVILAGKEEIV